MKGRPTEDFAHLLGLSTIMKYGQRTNHETERIIEGALKANLKTQTKRAIERSIAGQALAVLG